jgi:hypothetical protein
VKPEAVCCLFLLGFAIAFVPLSHLEIANAGRFPVGSPDLSIDITKPSLHPDNQNLALLAEDIGKLPMLINNTILPSVREVFLSYEDDLRGKYIESVNIEYDTSNKTMTVRVPTSSNVAADDPVQMVRIEPTKELQMSVIEQVLVTIPVYRNSTAQYLYESDGANSTVLLNSTKRDAIDHIHYVTIFDRMENLIPSEAKALADHTKEALTMHRDTLLDQNGTAEISGIFLKMLDFDMTRVTMTAPNDSGGWDKVVDEVKVGVMLRQFTAE